MPALSKEKRNQIIAVILGAIAIAAALWLGVIKTRTKGLEDARARLATAQLRFEAARNYVMKAEEIENEKAAALERLRSVEEGMASRDDRYQWSLQLIQKARTGQEVEVMDATRPDTKPVNLIPQFPYEAAVFTVKGNGYYHDFGKFLADFENRFPYFHVQNVTLGAAGESSVEVASGRMPKDKLLFKMDVIALIKPTP
jgi:hypothetical protein